MSLILGLWLIHSPDFPGHHLAPPLTPPRPESTQVFSLVKDLLWEVCWLLWPTVAFGPQFTRATGRQYQGRELRLMTEIMTGTDAEKIELSLSLGTREMGMEELMMAES